MNRNLFYFILLLGLGAAAYFLVIKKPWGTLSVDETAFAVEDTSAVGKVFIADMEGNKILLERTADGWIVNQQHAPRKDYIERLLSTLKNISVNYPVAESAQNMVIKDMASHNRKVEIYDRGGKLLRAYYVGKPSIDNLGTYMMVDGATKPYVMVIPGFQGTLETRYATEVNDIRSGKIYAFRPNEMKKVEVVYPAFPDSSFTIEILGPDSFMVKNNSGLVIPSHPNTVLEYLNHFKFVNAEAFLDEPRKKDSVTQTIPFCSITVTNRNDQPLATVIYRMPRLPDSVMQFDREGNPMPFDTDRFYATINNGADFVIIQQFHFGRLFKNLAFFAAVSNNGN